MGLLDIGSKVLDPGDFAGVRAGEAAADVSSEAARRDLQMRKDAYEKLRTQEAPTRDFRNWALGLINDYQSGNYTPTPDPGTAYALNQQEESIKSAAAARGRLESGDLATGIQSARATSAANTYNTGLNRLLQLAGYSVGDLNSGNSQKLQAAGGVSSAMNGMNAADQFGDTLQTNNLINLANQGGYLAGYAGRKPAGIGGGNSAASGNYYSNYSNYA